MSYSINESETKMLNYISLLKKTWERGRRGMMKVMAEDDRAIWGRNDRTIWVGE